MLLFFAALLASALLTVGGAMLDAREWVNDRFDWRDDEYVKLQRLHAGTTLGFFVSRLGEPQFQRPVDGKIPTVAFAKERFLGGEYVESFFRGRGYWVQTISNAEGSVIFFAVTACDDGFRPTFFAPYRAFKVVLNRSTFGQVVPWRQVRGEFGIQSRYFASGATANSSFIDILYAGNPLDYKTLVWGVNDACPDWFARYRRLLDRRLVVPLGTVSDFRGDTVRGGRPIRRFRAAVIVNTYGESAPLSAINFLRTPFQVGVDRIVIRTLGPS